TTRTGTPASGRPGHGLWTLSTGQMGASSTSPRIVPRRSSQPALEPRAQAVRSASSRNREETRARRTALGRVRRGGRSLAAVVGSDVGVGLGLEEPDVREVAE